MLKNKLSKNPDFTAIAILFCLSVLAYLWVFRHPLKWDMIDYFLPTRYFLSESLHNFSLPLWNPYQSMGLPFHSDPQSGAWYPIAWIFSVFGYYGFYHLSAEYLFHVFMGSVGAFLLAKHLFNETKIAFYVGLIYLMCGFFVSNAQHLSWIVSGAWIPFIFLFYLQLIKYNKTIDAIKVSFFLFLLFTGGYIAFSIVTFYILGFFGLYILIRMMAHKEYSKIYSFVAKNSILIVVFCLFSAVSIMSIFEALPYITRSNGLSVQKALENPFSFPSFISFILPYTTVKDYDFFKTDSSMANAYIGIIPLFFVVYSFFRKPPKWIVGLVLFSLLMLTLAVGDALPFRQWTYYHIPLMNMFRFPSLFRLFAILSLLIISAWSFNAFLKDHLKPNKAFWIIITIFILGFLTIILLSRMDNYIDLKKFVIHDSFRYNVQSTFTQHLVFQSAIQLFVLSGFALVILWKKIKPKLLCVFLIIMFDLCVATWLNTPYSIITKVFTLTEVEDKLDSFEHNYKIPEKITIYNEEKENHYGPLWQNLSTYSKNIPEDSYNPFALKTHTQLLQSLAFHNMELYIPKFVFYPKEFLPIQQNSKINGTDTAYLNFEDVSSFAVPDSNAGINILNFEPGKIEIETNVKSEQVLVIAQNFYPNWKIITEDGARLKQYNVNFNMIGIQIPKGKHVISMKYQPTAVIIMFWISVSSLFIFAIYLLLTSFFKTARNK